MSRDQNSTILPVILSGGSGSRLWPVSRQAYPKQFLNLAGEGSMIQETVRRVSDPAHFGAPIVISGAEQRFLVAEHLQAMDVNAQIVLEATGRNTAFPIAVAALMTAELAPERVLTILAADHYIEDATAFADCLIRAGRVAAEEQMIVTLGIQPTAPETGFGYILPDEPIASVEGAHTVGQFVEKPDAPTAEAYLAGGRHLWNSGVFVARADVLLEAFRRSAPEVLAAAHTALEKAATDLDFLRLDAGATAACPNISFDYAVMEHVERAAVIRAELGWSDLGSWTAIWETAGSDASGNGASGDVMALESRDCYLHAAPEAPMVVAMGLSDVVVVSTRDAVLAVGKDRVQDVKEVVTALKKKRRSEAVDHPRVYRPWGYYETLCLGGRFQVKRISVKPGGKLSLQSHQHRAEHWVVVSGTAIVTVDADETLLQENQSIYIPLGARHRLENRGKIELVLIEVQSGAYLGEDDIVRYEDVYARL